jgi:hypothetical protein
VVPRAPREPDSRGGILPTTPFPHNEATARLSPGARSMQVQAVAPSVCAARGFPAFRREWPCLPNLAGEQPAGTQNPTATAVMAHQINGVASSVDRAELNGRSARRRQQGWPIVSCRILSGYSRKRLERDWLAPLKGAAAFTKTKCSRPGNAVTAGAGGARKHGRARFPFRRLSSEQLRV